MIYKKIFIHFTQAMQIPCSTGEKRNKKRNFSDEILLSGHCQKDTGKVEEECDLQDYEGSKLYDEYPDRFMLYHLGRKIVDEVRSGG